MTKLTSYESDQLMARSISCLLEGIEMHAQRTTMGVKDRDKRVKIVRDKERMHARLLMNHEALKLFDEIVKSFNKYE